MSDGPRIPIERADALAAYLWQLWRLDSSCHVVGSVRRRRPLVGDLELLAPAAPKSSDRLCRAICETVEVGTGGLFRGTGPRPIGRALRGLKPGFLAASLIVRLADGLELPVQVYRHTPENFGWMLIERTGPVEFGKWFLGKWKVSFEIPIGDENHPASIDNHLVDRWKKRVPVPTEDDAFRLAGLKPVRPEIRDEYTDRVRAIAGVAR